MAKREKSAAVVTIHHAAKMSRPGRKAIAAWLRRQARFLEQYGGQFSGRFTARYRY